MPYKTDKKKLGSPFLDRRTKMLPCQKEAVKTLHASGSVSINGLARMFKVNKRLIQFILFPDRLAKNLKDRALNGGSMKYYDKNYHKEKMKEHRHHKYNTLKDLVVSK